MNNYYIIPIVPLQVASPAAAESAQHGQGEVPQPAGESTLQGAGHPGTGVVIIIIRAVLRQREDDHLVVAYCFAAAGSPASSAQEFWNYYDTIKTLC